MTRFLRYLKRHRILTVLLIAQGMVLLLLAPAVLGNNVNVSGTITYDLSWNTDGVTFTDDGWQVENNLGYTVEVERGYVVSYSVTANYCPHRHGLLANLLGFITPATAFAGHNSEHDVAELTASYNESLIALETVTLGTVTVNEPSYCEGHYLIASTDTDAATLPDDVDMYATSLYIEGQYIAPDSTTAVPFTIQSPLAWGTIQTLSENDSPDSIFHVTIGDTPVVLNFERQLASMFDGVDFSTMDERTQAMTILRALTDQVRMVIVEGQSHAA